MKRISGSLVLLLPVLILITSSQGGCTRQHEQASSTQKVESLEAFARLYGLVRYFYPGDEAAALDWSSFAVHGARRVMAAENLTQLRAELTALFAPIAPGAEIYLEHESPQDLWSQLPEDASELELVTWQHLGLGLSYRPNIYESKRLNRPAPSSRYHAQFGGIAQMVPADGLRGKKIRLSASMRAEIEESFGQGQLWLRVDREDGQPGFFDNMKDRPVVDSEWISVEIEGEVADDADQVVFGGFLAGIGKVWIDDVKLGIESEGEWAEITIKDAGFESQDDESAWFRSGAGYEFDVVSERPAQGRSSMQISRPADSAQEMLFEHHAQLGELRTRELAPGLLCQVPLALPSRDGQTLPAASVPMDELQAALDRISESDPGAEDEGVRAAGVVILWNAVQHFYPYHDTLDISWNETLGEALEDALASEDARAYRAALERLVVKMSDGHGNVFHPGVDTDLAWLPFSLDIVDDRAVVIATVGELEISVGDIVEQIDGRDVQEMITEQIARASGSAQWRQVRSLHRIIRGRKGSTTSITVRRGNDVETVQIERALPQPPPAQNHPKLMELEGGIKYVNLAKAPWNEIAPRLEELAAAPGLILDLRGYPKGNHQILMHLMKEEDTSTRWMRVPQIIYPDQEKLIHFRESGWNMLPAQPRITGKVAFITGPMAISYAESVMGLVEHYRLGEIVGRPTAGANGNVNIIKLPGGYRVSWTGMQVVKHDGSQHHLIGIQPTVPVSRTIAAIAAGRDEELERAIEVVS